jgi:hypothetical protein
LRVESEPVEGISLRIDRVATPWTAAALEQALLGGRAVTAFAPAPASPGRRFEAHQAQRAIASATGTSPDGALFRVDYVLASLRGETVVARYLGPADSIAFNLGLLHRSLESLEAEPLLTDPVRAPVGVAIDKAASPDPAGNRVPFPAGWAVEPPASAACPGLPPADEGAAASPSGDFTVVFRMMRWERLRAAAERASRACGSGPASGEGYSRRFSRLGVAMGASGILVPQANGLVLLEVEAPEAKLPFVRDLFDAWARRFGKKSPAS